ELPRRLPAPLLGTTDELLDILSKTPVSELYIAGRVLEHGNAMQHVVDACEVVGMPFAVPLHSLRFERAHILSTSPARDGYLHYLTTPSKPLSSAVKRLLDIVASTAA